ncbi:MAG: transporter substrate-binding domain-containing protein, partial [Pseudobdellovibrionaceae bacterium]|nr:transporter substrate-binding domain-containing protein [Pseudobdellovibrionaceae bacterium]
FLPRKRAYADTKNGKYLASFPWFQDEEREKDFLFSETLDSTAGGVVVPMSSDLQFFTRQSARRKKACDLLGSHFQSQLFIDEQVTVTRVTDLSQCLKMIKEKRIDFYFAAFSSVSKEILGTEAKIIPTDLDLVLKMHLIISRNHPQAQKVMADFNRELMASKKNGTAN